MSTTFSAIPNDAARRAARRITMKKLVLVVGFALLAFHPAPARAGIADSPVPILQGHKAQHIFSVSGVVTAGGLGTYFSCTSVAPIDVAVSVELFSEDGSGPCNDASAVALSVAPGATVMFATQNVNSAFSSVQLLTPTPVFIGHGSARILSSSKLLVCTAFLADAYNDPPTSMAALTVVSRTKQRGS